MSHDYAFYLYLRCAFLFLSIAINCPTLNDPLYGSIRYIGSGFGAIVRYSCDRGFNLVGDSSRICKSYGEWSGSDPTCVEGWLIGTISALATLTVHGSAF